MKTTSTCSSSDKVKIELSAGVLSQLINSGVLHGNQCRCLDINAKNILWQSLLSSSLGKINKECI